MATRKAGVTGGSSVSFASGPVRFVSWSVTARNRPLDLPITVTFRDGHGGDVIGDPAELEPGQSDAGVVAALDQALTRGLHVEVDAPNEPGAGSPQTNAAAEIEVVTYADGDPVSYGDLRALELAD